MKKLSLDDMKATAQERGGLCLSESYEGSKSKLLWRCANGHEWDARADSVKAGTWCRQCAAVATANKLRIPLSAIQELAKSKGGECLAHEYLGNKDDKLRWCCSRGHEWEATLGKVRNDGSWCPICARLNQSLTPEDMRELARAKGGECLSDSYQGQDVKLRWRCAMGHEWNAAPGHIRNQGCWCPKCAGRARLTIDEMQALAESKEGECLSESVVNARMKLRWRCANGHEFLAPPNDVKSGHWCRKCAMLLQAERQRTPFNEIQQLARSRGGECLSGSYSDNASLLRWRCARGHEWEASLRNVKHNNSWCPICGAGVSERICRAVFEAIFGTLFPKARPEWLRNERGNWMELDGYAEELGLAFEYHGVQHFKPIGFFHASDEAFLLRQRDDRKRAAMCREKGINLIEVPYMIPHDEIESFIRAECARQGITVPRTEPVDIATLPVYEEDPLDKLRATAEMKGGMLLSTAYINRATKMRWRCAEGHEWEAPSSAIITSGQWCPLCGIKRRSDAQRLTIKDMHALARSRGGKFLSATYEGLRFKHRWKCAQGHEWDARAGNVKNGSWCPECAGLAPLSIEEMHSLAAAKGGICLSDRYLGTATKLRWRCKQGHEWETTPDKIKYREQWCPICARNGARAKQS